MNLNPLASLSVMMVPLADPGDVLAAKPCTSMTRSARAYKRHAVPIGDDSALRHATDAQRLLLVQEGRVICVVERIRHDSALSVARLLCRLCQSEAFVYACPAADADHLHPDDQLEQVPDTWQEVYRATTWTEPMIDESQSLPVVGIH